MTKEHCILLFDPLFAQNRTKYANKVGKYFIYNMRADPVSQYGLPRACREFSLRVIRQR